ncbi:MAG: molecular chaperone HtpG [Sphaerochaetaceae bacterium]|jgi:molecular chaperone HtpG|nr:molecular chaperone HtpG [Spirochaetaceae bacterium]MDY6344786.1 molecular chaperone HtpG [Sphaerochaetaceae bacterium]
MAEMQFKTEVNDLLHLIIHSLYSNKEIFLRELISNASDALDKLKYLTLTDEKLKGLAFDPRIDISFTEGDKRTLVITDNGIGMNEDDLNTNLGTIASSGTKRFLASLTDEQKKDSNLIGQFGVGFYSAFMVADRIEVVSRKAGEKQAYKWSSDGKGSYSIDPAERDGQGTTITLYLNEDGGDYANRWELEQLVKKYSDNISFPIFLAYDDVTYDDKEKDKDGNAKKVVTHKVEQINSCQALWKRSKSELKPEDYQNFYKNTFHDTDDAMFYLHTKAEGSIEYTTLFYVPKTAPFDMYYADYKPGVRLYVKRVFITDDDKQLLPTYLRFVRGIIDSEDLPLNVSREILQQNRIMSSIRSNSVKKLLAEFKRISEQEPEKYIEFIKQYNRPLKEGLYSDWENRDELMELVRFKSSKVDGYVSLKDYKSRMPKDQKSIYYISGGKEETLKASPLIEAYTKKGYEVLVLDEEIDEFVASSIGSYQSLPLKAINKSGSMDDLKDEASKQKEEAGKGVVEKIKASLKDQVKDVVVSSRLTDTPAVIVVDDSAPTVQMQQILKQMGQPVVESKPILEINADDPMIKKIGSESDQKLVDTWCGVLLDQALLAQGVMPKDPVAFTRRLHELLSR